MAGTDTIAQAPILRRARRGMSRGVFAYVLNAPAIAILVALVAYPIIDAFWLSLHRFNLRRPEVFDFVGLQNYVDVVTSDLFITSLAVTLLFTFWSTVGVLVLALGAALVANEKTPEQPILRALLLLPWAMPGVVTALMWKWIFHPQAGALNGLLYSLGLIPKYRSWLMSPDTSYLSIITANIWNSMPFSVLVLLAALQAIPSELYDAAKVDGADAIGRFRFVTLPWLIHPILIVLIVQALGGIRIFEIIYLLTGGGPGNASTTLGFATYITSFVSTDIGRGNAWAYTVALLTLVIAIVYMKLLYGRGDIRS
ncbi:MAG TPA: sugar ABC transporter permease [Chloroflexota bacterium]|jgi:multiple sugar transport system permease protein|nr:sugar ABC transporter permease [Chloroflexota bacterium]